MYDTKHEFNVNYGLWVTMIYQYMFIICNKCTFLVVDIEMGEVMHMWEQENISTFLLI